MLVQYTRTYGPWALNASKLSEHALDLSYFTQKSECAFINLLNNICQGEPAAVGVPPPTYISPPHIHTHDVWCIMSFLRQHTNYVLKIVKLNFNWADNLDIPSILVKSLIPLGELSKLPYMNQQSGTWLMTHPPINLDRQLSFWMDKKWPF